MYCPNCGEAIPEDSEYCRHCGTDIGEETDIDPTDVGTEQSPNDIWWLGLVISPLAVLSGFIFGFWYGFAGSTTNQAPVLVGTLATITELGGIALGIFVSPIALYLDKKYIRSVSEWDPSSLYYLVVIPYMTIIVTAVYLYKRKKLVGL